MNGIMAENLDGAFGMPVPPERSVLSKMAAFSVVVHLAVFLVGSVVSPLFRTEGAPPVVVVELADLPMPELPEEAPAPAPTASIHKAERAEPSPRTDGSRRTDATQARRWLDRLDAGIPKIPDAPVSRAAGRVGDLPARHWTREGPPKPGDFAPAVAPERGARLAEQLDRLEARVRGAGRARVGLGEEVEASMMFGQTGDAAAEPIPAWVAEMIRKRVRAYLPELEAVYNDAIRRNPDLGGRLLVRFRIGPSGRIQTAEPAEEAFGDRSFVDAVLGKVRRWTFAPTGGRAVDVIYPFVFVVPS